jgi:NAD(P)-dependent dehydrogenase (short-subunit alcohol dehydrogenase family)
MKSWLTLPKYDKTSPEFQARIKPFLQTTPLANPRDGIDKPEFVASFEKTGGRPAYEYEIAGLVGLLCSPEASFTTGSVLNANGGMKFSY